MIHFQIFVFLVWLAGVSVWAAGNPAGSVSNQVWHSDFMGRDYGVLSPERSFAPGVKLCGGLPKGDRTLALVMTVLQYEGIGKQSRYARLQYFSPAFGYEQLVKRAEWMKGEALDGDERHAVEALFKGYAGRYVSCIPHMDTGSTMFVGMAKEMKRNVFGWWFDVEGACRKLERNNGWTVDVEAFRTLSFEQLTRLLNKRLLPILAPRNKRYGVEGSVLALGACSNATGRFVMCASPVDCGLGAKSYFDQVSNTQSGFEWGELLALPGSAEWNWRERDKKNMWPDDMEITCADDLPKGCFVIPYDAADWDVMVLKDLRPAWSLFKPELERLLAKPGATSNAVPSEVPTNGADVALWTKYFLGHESCASGTDWYLIPGVRCCGVDGQTTPFVATFATVVCRSHPEGTRLVERSYEWRSVVLFSCQERWRQTVDKQQRAIIEKYAPNAGRMPLGWECEYADGKRLWSVEADGEKQLRTMYQEATNGVALGSIKPEVGQTRLQQVGARLQPIEGSDLVKLALSRVADRYGWGAKLEQVEDPSFTVLKRAVEMGIPALLKQSGSGKWVVGMGYLAEGGEEYLLVLDPTEMKPEKMAQGVSQEEHDFRMALSDRFPGHGRYVKAAERSGYVTDRLLDPLRPLPEGCHFIRMSNHPFAAAYFIHDWSQAVCGQEKIAEIVAKTKPLLPEWWNDKK